jgi:hypothetical protein
MGGTYQQGKELKEICDSLGIKYYFDSVSWEMVFLPPEPKVDWSEGAESMYYSLSNLFVQAPSELRVNRQRVISLTRNGYMYWILLEWVGGKKHGEK